MNRLTNKILTIFLTLIIIVLTCGIAPVMAINGVTLGFKNYVIEYLIVGEWENNQNVEITIKNIGNEPIYNWALEFDAGGEISGLWNGTIYDRNGTSYIIKNAGYNYEILPGESVVWGYMLSGDNLDVPKSFELCSKKVI